MTMAYVAVAVSVVGMGISAYGQYEKGQSDKAAMEYNAEMDERAAHDLLEKGAHDAARLKEQTRKLISAQTAAGGASGFDTSVGTPLDLSVEAAGFGELDALTTINNAQRQGSGMKAQATLDRYQGKMSAQAGTLNAAGTVFQGAGNAYYGYKKGVLAGK